MKHLSSGLLFAIGMVLCVSSCDKTTRVTKIDPPTGNVAGGEDVLIWGNGFRQGMKVHFGQQQVRAVIVDGGDRTKVKTPAGSEGVVDIIVTDASGQVYVLKQGYRYRTKGSP